ncbi:Myb_DNA-bind_3 domain-containing protein [Gossypium australe]|uniref:Myb_DNA-bind_3 domain-containing protein n=1 Tax=Gossypium australe TaxID=47621 RepID=A0A5B6XA85_9ROSI|nr:Myb_DNA-bind_3 domain-containing protein [Gossypium australe]
MGKSKNINVNKRNTQPMDDVLIDALLHQQSLGNRIDRVFTTMAYENMANELHEKIGIPIEKGLLKNRIKTLKHNFYECYDLFNCRSGFAWSPDTKMWTAKPELWKALAKSKPDAKKWMITRIANYGMLVMLFTKDREKRKGAERGQLGCSIGGRVFDGIPLQDVVGASMEEKDTNE